MGAINSLYARYKDQVEFFVVYIREAHASDSNWPDPVLDVPTPQSFSERADVAKTCSAKLDLKLPMLIDDMKNTADKLYRGWPDRLFLVAKDGTLAYKGARGPWGFKPKDLAKAIEVQLAERAPTTVKAGAKKDRRWY